MSEPEHPTDLSGRAWWKALRRTVSEAQDDNLTDWAAALTYYAVLSIFPALIALVSILGVFGDPVATTRAVTDIATALGPASVAETLRGPVESLTANRGAAGVLLIIGLGAALWTASGYVGAFIRASNRIYEVEEGRPFWKRRPLQLLMTAALIVMLALVAGALVLTGPLARAVGGVVGLSEAAVTAWEIAKWPVLLAILLTVLAMMYYAAPNAKLPGFRWITPGSVAAVLLWIAASVAFAFYVANFGSYDKTYGTLGGVITFLIWLWIGNLAVLFGLELNAELERSRELEAGESGAEQRLQLEPRQAPQA